MNPTAKYQKRNYLTWRRFFIAALGGKCVHCGSTCKLELDHIEPYPDNAMSGSGRFMRARDWKEQFLKHNLQVSCRDCNMERRIFK
jgi:5-methylcytosine-specific restriction endonuclease McrA